MPSPAQERLKIMPELTLLQMSNGQIMSQLIYIAAKLGIADQLAGGPLDVAQLAANLQVNAQALYRIMRALASLGLFTEVDERKFGLTALAQPLRTHYPGSIRSWVIFTGEPWHRRVWSEILYSATTGEAAFEHVFGMGTFEYFAQNPEDGEIFNQAMRGMTHSLSAAVIAAYEFSGIKTIVDIGGGTGALLTAILQANPRANGILFDRPQVIEEAQPMIESAGIASRCTLMPGSFFDSVPEGADLYLMKHIIHDWDDNTAITILQNCRRAMPAHAKLLLAEMVIPVGNVSHVSKLIDIMMLILEGGQERTESEFQSLLVASGFELPRFIDTKSTLRLIETVPV